MIFFITSKYGPAMSSDGVYYLSTADSIADGNGFINFRDEPLIYYPPLLPFILGIIEYLFGLDPFLSGWILGAVSFGLNIFLTAYLIEKILPENKIWGNIGALITLSSLSLISISANFGSDALFVTFTLIYFLFGHNYLTSGKYKWLAAFSIVCGLSAILRFNGLALIVTGFIVIIVKLLRDKKINVKVLIIYGIFSMMPIVIWIIGRNYLLYGIFFGSRVGDIFVVLNSVNQITKILHWYLPLWLIKPIPILVIGGLIFFFMLLINNKKRWKILYEKLKNPSLLIYLIPIPLFFSIAALSTITGDHHIIFDDRYISPIFIPLTIIIILIFERLVIQPLNIWRNKFGSIVLLVGFIFWLSFPIRSIFKYTSNSLKDGVTTYNSYNQNEFLDLEIADYINKFEFDSEYKIYSNNPAAVYFFTRNKATSSLKNPAIQYYETEIPINFGLVDTGRRKVENAAEANYADDNWPEGENAYLVWFSFIDREFLYNLEELNEIVELSPIYSGNDGGIYLISRK